MNMFVILNELEDKVSGFRYKFYGS